MKLLLKTKMLIGVFSVLLALNFVEGQPKFSVQELPVIPELHRELITKIEISKAAEKVILVQNDGVWYQEAPLKGKADQARIRSMVLNFRKKIPMDALIDSDNEKEYGLDMGNAIVVEMWTDEGEPTASFLLGNDLQGTSSFVRLTGSDAIYRARVGGKRRYNYSPNEWLSQQLLGLDVNDITAVSVSSKEGYLLDITKGFSAWEIPSVETAVLNQDEVSNAMRALAAIRIGERIAELDFVPSYSFQITTANEKKISFSISEISQGSVIVELNNEYFRVAAASLQRFLQGQDFFFDRRLNSINNREDIDIIRFQSSTNQIIVQQDLSNGFWNVLEPGNIDLDIREIFFMVNTLISLEYQEKFSDTQIDFGKEKFQITLRTLAGALVNFTFYQAKNGVLYLRKEQENIVYVVSRKDVETIAKGFAQKSILER